MEVGKQPFRTVLTMTVGFLVIFWFTEFRWFFYISLFLGLVGVSSRYMSEWVEFLWMKLGDFLGLIVPNILLSLIFFLILVPIAFLSRVLGKSDPLELKNDKDSFFHAKKGGIDKEHFEKPW